MLDRNQQCDAILLDFEKAFDKVPHSRLIHKLHSVGINDKTIQWITSFLRNRTQQVIIEGAKSDISNVTSGVPQGSVLRPTLFLIYINDISDGLESTIRLFADDTIIYRCIESQNDVTTLQEDLHKLENWENKWLMSFNTSKCQHLPITNKRNPIKSDYSLHNQRLETVKDAKYLGVNLNEKLNWSNHIDNICKKANASSAFICRNLRGTSRSTKRTAFVTISRPVLEFASACWDPASSVLTDKIEMVQRRTARRIYSNFNKDCSPSALLKDLDLSRQDVKQAK